MLIFSQKLPENPLRASALYMLLGLLLFAGFPHVGNLPLWVMLAFFVLVAIRIYLVHRNIIRIYPHLPVIVAVPVVASVYLQFGTLLGIEASISLLLLMLALKALEIRAYRDAMLCLFLCAFVVITVFLFHQQLLTLPYLVTNVLLFSLCLLRLNDYTGRQSIRYQLKLTAKLLLAAVPVVLVLFVLFPRLESPFWSLPSNNSAETGISDSMQPGQFSRVVRSSEPAFRVTFSGTPPPQDQLYWRGPVLAGFDGQRWSRMESLSDRIDHRSPDLARLGNTVSYELALLPTRSHWVFALDMPISIPEDAEVNQAGETLAKDLIRETRSFEFTSARSFIFDGDPGTEQVREALQLPARGAPRTRALARDLFEQSGNDPARFVELVMQRFYHEPYSYTLQPKPLSSDYIDSFMFDTREGFCEHFSSSFVVMMRAAGVPARVVTGYQGGEFNQVGDGSEYLLVRQSDAHAWAEVWLPGRGWVRKDPTGMVAPERVNEGLQSALADDSRLPRTLRISTLKRLSLQWDALNYRWSRWVVSYDSELRSEFLRGIQTFFFQHGERIVKGFLSLAVLICAGLLVNLWRNARNNRAPAHVKLYRQWTEYLTRSGLATPAPGDTAITLAERVGRQQPGLQTPANDIAWLFSRLHYAPDGGSNVAELNEKIREFRLLAK